MFEKRLKEMYPHMKDITYDIADLYNYVDALADLKRVAIVVVRELIAHLKQERQRVGGLD